MVPCRVLLGASRATEVGMSPSPPVKTCQAVIPRTPALFNVNNENKNRKSEKRECLGEL